MNFDYSNPVNFRFGEGRLDEAGEAASRLGEKALIVTGKSSMRKQGFTDHLEESLDEAGIDHVAFERIEPNPLTTTVDEGAETARDGDCDLVVGLGGGSAMDAAKAIAVAAEEGTPFWRFAPGNDADLSNADALPVLCIPSTSGTGSEANQYAVVSNPETGEKPGLGSDAMYPAASIVDPEVSGTMPPRLTATTGIDVVMHALEALVSRNSNPVSDSQAIEALRLSGKHLRDAHRDGDDPEARAGMAAASSLAGMAIASAGTGLIHALEHPVSGMHRDVAHADGLAALSLPVLDLNRSAEPRKYSRASHILSKGKERDIREALQILLGDLDLPTGLAELGVEEEDLPAIVSGARETMAGTIEANPVHPTEEEMMEVLKDAL